MWASDSDLSASECGRGALEPSALVVDCASRAGAFNATTRRIAVTEIADDCRSLGCLIESMALLRWDRDQGHRILVAGIGECKEKHEHSKGTFGFEVAVIDPIPIVLIKYGAVGIVGFVL